MSNPELQIGKAVEASTDDSSGKAGRPDAFVYYDENCPFCRHLAHLISKSVDASRLVLLPSPESDPSELVVVAGETTHVGRDAWSWLIEHQPVFKEWNWLATKLGLRDEGVTLVMRGAEVLRRLCPTCRRSSGRA